MISDIVFHDAPFTSNKEDVVAFREEGHENAASVSRVDSIDQDCTHALESIELRSRFLRVVVSQRPI